METRVAIAAIIVENPDSVAPLNELLHEYSRYIIGRMGIPYKEKGISIISIAGKIGRLTGVSTKTTYSNH